MKFEQNNPNTRRHKIVTFSSKRNRRTDSYTHTGKNWQTRGNLSQKSLSGIVKREDVVLDSEYLETIFIAVPRSSLPLCSLLTPRNEERSFNAKYETLTPNVVPRSAQKLAQDDEFSLYSVTLFRRDIPEFGHRSREFKFPSVVPLQD